MSAKFPTEFSLECAALLCDFFRPSKRDTHCARAYAEAAWCLQGFALGQLIPETCPVPHEVPKMLKSSTEHFTSGESLATLEECREFFAPAGEGGIKAGKVDWAKIMAVLSAILQQLAPLFDQK